eukprot:SAG31_NODE_11374_length_1037_cov_1.321962_1_plen_104_part_10
MSILLQLKAVRVPWRDWGEEMECRCHCLILFLAATAAIGCATFLHLLSLPPPPRATSPEKSFTEPPMPLPALSGSALQALVLVLETPIFGQLIAKIITNTGPFA